jgi:hypothetical protein
VIIPRAATARDREQVFNVRKRPLRVFGARRAGEIVAQRDKRVGILRGGCVGVGAGRSWGVFCHMQKEDIQKKMVFVEEKIRVCKVYR